MWPTILIIIYCVLVGVASFLGGTLPSLLRLTHTRMQLIMSFVGGLVLGVAVLHLLPHSAIETQSWDGTCNSALIGLLTMFLLIRTFHVHQHGPVAEASACQHDPAESACAQHGHDHSHDPTEGECCDAHRPPYSWIGLGVGLSLHTLIDGMALAASVSAQGHAAGSGVRLFGVGTFLAVLLHKPLDAMSITSVMATGGWSLRVQRAVNLAFALMCALGALCFYLGIQHLVETQHAVLGSALGFAAGVFLCIALADILPEVHFHAHDRFKLSAALLLGVLLAYGIGFVEPEHPHGQDAAVVHVGEAGH
jgi:zinc and cadmium transporter